MRKFDTHLPIDEALPIAKQIADALEAAHEQGIIHRDLKPANVKITPAGKVKVLDFGLAKAMERTPTTGDPSNSPTLSMAATQAGVLLGTAAYMSPEQAKGQTVDQRSDVFSFGSVLFEMLAETLLRPMFLASFSAPGISEMKISCQSPAPASGAVRDAWESIRSLP